ncbi:hypothetical protein PVAND_017544 [Polypedilum vanderplanki]|uniref:Uncharacterized protein n=1 Tax=Polypedilum vanderplanki TaxID=319348 RepID=A0A9J6BIL4_POLVA|nr:hypothetical protein PVAND_017544 [Polypedilum vanderplanki]
MVASSSDIETCGDGAVWTTDGFACKFFCSSDGVTVDCNVPGCKCPDSKHYYNTQTKTCMEVNCDNMNCANKPNEYYFKGCESGSRERCPCSKRTTFDCRKGCMCKNGYCRKEGKCVPRDCEHPIYGTNQL